MACWRPSCWQRIGSHRIAPRLVRALSSGDDARRRIDELRTKLQRYNSDYYQDGVRSIPDSNFDAAFEELQALEEQFPSLASSSSPTATVGARVSGAPSIAHSSPMLSLRSVFKVSDVTAFLRKPSSIGTYCWSVEHKLDGMALALRYDADGHFLMALSRGDGAQGEDVTEGVRRCVSNLPMQVDNSLGVPFEVRCEAVLKTTAREVLGDRPLRNAAVGLLRRTVNLGDNGDRPIDLICYSLQVDDDIPSLSTHSARLKLLASMGFSIDLQAVVTNPADVLHAIRHAKRTRSSFAYETDGVVVKVDSINEQNVLGLSRRAPRWALAYKFDAKSANTQLEHVEFNVGRTGRVTPVAIVTPCMIGGVRVSRASLHNIKHFHDMGPLHAGMSVVVERIGDVIPMIKSVSAPNESLASGDAFALPRDEHGRIVCPCEQRIPLTGSPGDPHMSCSSASCSSARIGAFSHAVSKRALDIHGFGAQSIRALVEAGLMNDIPDLFALDGSKLMELEGWGEIKIRNLVRSLQKAKMNTPPERVLYALGINHIGSAVSASLIAHFRSIDRIATATCEELVGVADIGPVAADAILSYFKSATGVDMVRRLGEIGLCTPVAPATILPLSKTRIVLTGKFERGSRTDAALALRQLGALVSDRVTSQTEMVVRGAAQSLRRSCKKIADAERLGVTVAQEDVVWEMIDRNMSGIYKNNQ